ncbi:hypothetical protein [Streptomyces sp. NPDC089799]|uniref:hypothetical protein n=1 Tax=Streptomyces sp. NPDC089799 TaxID=3155066 RepID=UPI003448CB32
MEACTREEFRHRLELLERTAAFPNRQSLRLEIAQALKADRQNGRPRQAPTPQNISAWTTGTNLPRDFSGIAPLITTLIARARRRTPQSAVPGLYELHQWRLWHGEAKVRGSRPRKDPVRRSDEDPEAVGDAAADHEVFMAEFAQTLNEVSTGRAVAEALEHRGRPAQARQFVRWLANRWPADLLALACQFMSGEHRGELLRAAARWHAPPSFVELVEELADEEIELSALLTTAVEQRPVREIAAVFHDLAQRTDEIRADWGDAFIATAVLRSVSEVTDLMDQLGGLGDTVAAASLLRFALVFRPGRDVARIMEWVREQADQDLLDQARGAAAMRRYQTVPEEPDASPPAGIAPPETALCPRCRVRSLEQPGGSRLTDERDVDICGPCSSDEAIYDSMGMTQIPKRQWPVSAVFDWQDQVTMAQVLRKSREESPA